MKLTQQQRAAVAAHGNTYVDACPGSGKTRVLVAKALREVKKVVGSPRKIACITFTNAAVDEMERRLRTLATENEANFVDIGTIHSFCLTKIFKPFRCRTKDYAADFEIVGGDDDRARDLFIEIAGRRGLKAAQFQLDAVSQMAIDPDGSPVPGDVDQWILDCMTEYWQEYRRRGWLDFSLLLYESLSLLRSFPEICDSLSAKYMTVLVDEFQDTTRLQLEILRLIHSSQSSVFFLVGDHHQSIYRFAGASPDSSKAFVQAIGAGQDFPLTGNFRSAFQIVNGADHLLPRQPSMNAVGEWAQKGADISIYEAANVGQAVVDNFVSTISQRGLNVGSCAVLAARWTDLLAIARACGRSRIPVIGPGARPYKRGRLIVPLLENLAAVAHQGVSLRATQRSMMRCADELEGFNSSLLEGWSGRVIALELHAAALGAAAKDAAPLTWIVNIGDEIDRIMHARGVGSSRAFHMSAQEVVADIYSNAKYIDMDAITIENLALFANPSGALKLMTIHASKGREFDAVAIVHTNEGRFPHFKAQTADQIDDGRRVFYVGVTRAKRLLHLVVDTSDWRNGPSRFIAELR